MMTQKEYILRALKLFPDWEMGWGIKAMVENNQLEEPILNRLVIVFDKALNEINNTIDRYNMLETIETAKNFDKQKEEQAKQDAENLVQLDSMLNDL